MSANPLDGFVVDPSQIEFIGHDLQRPECIVAERDGTLWSADARGGVVRMRPDGNQEIITQNRPPPSPRPPTTSSALPRERCQTVSPSPATAISLSPISEPIASRS